MFKITGLVMLVMVLQVSAQDFYSAGNDLKSARTFFWMGATLTVAGTTLMLITKPSYTKPDGQQWNDPKTPIGISVNVVGLVCHFLAWQKIGAAGQKLATVEKR